MRAPPGLVMEICCSGVYTFLVTLVFEQLQCPESMNRNTFLCFHPDPEPCSPRPLLSHTHKGSNPWIKPFLPFRERQRWYRQNNWQKDWMRENHSSVLCAAVCLLEVACSLDAFCLASGLILLPSPLLPPSVFLTLSPSLPLVHLITLPPSVLLRQPRSLSLPTFPSES